MFGKLILLYKSLSEAQKNVVLLKWANGYYVDGTVLKEKMSQDIKDFKSLAIVVNDLKDALEPKYMWIFRKISTLKGGQEFIQEIYDEILSMFLRCPEMSLFQKIAINELKDNIKTIQSVKSDVIFSRYIYLFIKLV